MSIQTEITRIESAKTAIATAIEGKGVTVPDGTKLDGMAALIEAISAGGGDKIAIGSFTPSEACSYYEIVHNLGQVPMGAMCFCSEIIRSSYEFLFDNGSVRLCWFNGSGYFSGTSDLSTSKLTSTTIGDSALSDSSMFRATENTICAGNDTTSSKYFLAGKTYMWIVWVTA